MRIIRNLIQIMILIFNFFNSILARSLIKYIEIGGVHNKFDVPRQPNRLRRLPANAPVEGSLAPRRLLSNRECRGRLDYPGIRHAEAYPTAHYELVCVSRCFHKETKALLIIS